LKKRPKLKKDSGVEKIFPNARARQKADEAVDALDVHLDMRAFLDAWEQAYFDVAGESPFRQGDE
jgi:hypothetical protein